MLLMFGFVNAQCKVYSGSSGWNVAARSEGCGGMSFAAAAVVCCL